MLHLQLQMIGSVDSSQALVQTRQRQARPPAVQRVEQPPPPPDTELSPPPSPIPPPLPSQLTVASAPLDRGDLAFDNGEAVGGPSSASLCVLMPVRSSSLARALRSVRTWAESRAAPCTSPAADSGAVAADFAFFHSQSFDSERDVRTAQEMLRALRVPAGSSTQSSRWPPTACVGAVRFLAARISVEDDVYTIYPTHNFTGPNTHFLRAFSRLRALAKEGVAQYSHFQLLESDTYPVRPGWLAQLATIAPRGKAWVRGSLSQCLRPTEQTHVNGNALYALSPQFVRELQGEMGKRIDSWAFDVMIGYWLQRARPGKIQSSAHILSLSTFQRNRSCCEYVEQLVKTPTEARAARPKLYLLHTGNIGKLPDSGVAPSMRSLGMSLQDQFVPRSAEPCLGTAEDTKLPPRIAAPMRRAQPWRARLKALGDCRMPQPAPQPIWWVPAAEAPSGGEGGDADVGAWARSLLLEAFGVRVRWVDDGDDRHDDEDDDASGLSVQGGTLCALLRRVEASGGAGQLFAMVHEPSALLWHNYLAHLAARGATGDARCAADGGAEKFEAWLDTMPDNPMVRALNGCGAQGLPPPRRARTTGTGTTPPVAASDDERGGGGGGGGGTGGAWEPRLNASELEAAKQALQEKALIGTVGSFNRTQRSLVLLATYFGWAEAPHGRATAAEQGGGGGGGPDDGGALGGADVAPQVPFGSASLAALLQRAPLAPPPNSACAAAARRKVALDAKLYEFAARLSDEQARSVVWEEENATDVCAAADAASLGLMRRAAPLPLSLDEHAAYDFDGEGYRCYELRLRTPLKAVQLFVKGRNLIGASSFTINVLISHRSTTPTFSEHSFRYVYESRPPHKHSGKFLLTAAKLRTCCVEAAAAAGAANASATCDAEGLVLWVAFKCRAVAVTQLTVLAVNKGNGGGGSPSGGG